MEFVEIYGICETFRCDRADAMRMIEDIEWIAQRHEEICDEKDRQQHAADNEQDDADDGDDDMSQSDDDEDADEVESSTPRAGGQGTDVVGTTSRKELDRRRFLRKLNQRRVSCCVMKKIPRLPSSSGIFLQEFSLSYHVILLKVFSIARQAGQAVCLIWKAIK